MRVVVGCALVCLPTLWLAGCQSDAGDRAGSPASGASQVIAVGAVQGRGAKSPLVGKQVTVHGVLRADFSGQFSSDGDLGGWFLQDGGDGDSATSDGLYIDATPPPGLTRGIAARVTGTVVERDGGGGVTVTTLKPTRVEMQQVDWPVPETIVLVALPTDWEALEGMRVRIDAPLRLRDASELDMKGRLAVEFEGASAASAPSTVAAVNAHAAGRQFVLDDGRTGSPSPISWGLFPDGIANAPLGSTLTGAEGIVDHREGGYRLQLLTAAQLHPGNTSLPLQSQGDAP